jgi:hypothetical protein
MARIITAKYDGECPLCDLPITADVDRIVWDDIENTWVHVNCQREENDWRGRGDAAAERARKDKRG